MPYIEDFSEFKSRMACPYVRVERGFIFANGAVSDGRQQHVEPPDAETRLRLQIEYQEVRLQQEEKLFTECQSYITLQSEYYAGGAGPEPEPEALDDLRRFSESVSRRREVLAEMQARLKAMQGPSLWDKAQAERTRRKNAATKIAQQALSVEP